MAATVDRDRQVVYVTGAIDQKHTSIVTRIRLPESKSNVWRVVKAETNLTDSSWVAWQIRLGGDCRMVKDSKSGFSQQFRNCDYVGDRNAILFSGGEVRPGEPVLKEFEVAIGEKSELVMSHNRIAREPFEEVIREKLLEGFGYDEPVVEMDIPVRFR
ncbi:MAG: DUF6423 family protein [Paracoccaceae bacterium]|nr:DUF6423 family protein [Paracoccaceae bacterium]